MADEDKNTSNFCALCGVFTKTPALILEGDRPVCDRCAPGVRAAREYAEKKAAEAAEQARKIQEGLCKFCAKTSFCEMVERFGECKPGDRCTEFVDKEGLKKKDIQTLKKQHGKVPIASDSPKPTNKKSQPPKEDVYHWIISVKEELSEEHQEEVAKMIEGGISEEELKKKITLMLLKRRDKK